MFTPSPISASRYGLTTCLRAEERNPRRKEGLKVVETEQIPLTCNGALSKDDLRNMLRFIPTQSKTNPDDFYVSDNNVS